MQLGIGSYTYTWAIGVPGYPGKGKGLTALELIDKAAEHNIKVVQICDNLPLINLSGEELQTIKSKAGEYGIAIEAGTRGIEPEHIKRYLEIAGFLDAKLLRTILHKDGGKLSVREAVASIRNIIPELERTNIRLAIENHERHAAKELKEIITQINHHQVGICLDTVNSFGAMEGPDQVMDELLPHMINLHYKDFIINRAGHNLGFEITGRPAGQGMLPADRLKRHLEHMSEDISIILELWTPYTNTVEETALLENQWAKESINYLKEWIRG